MTRRAIVLFPAGQAMRRIESVRQRTDPLAARIPAHLTVVFPFESEIDPEELELHVASGVGHLPAFDLVFADVSTEDDGYLFLNVGRGDRAIEELHERLYTGPLRRYFPEGEAYRPHLTLGRIGTGNARATAANAAAKLAGNQVAQVSAVTIVRLGADGNWSAECTIPLRGGRSPVVAGAGVA